MALSILAFGAALAACGPQNKPPTSLFWDVPPPIASTEAVLVASAAYIGDVFAEAEQRLKNTGEASAPAPSF
ncbi:hypothetical protein [Variovorax arabinosiphilus]|uniref:hypothetical protein n=1 Tax=Variovorax arabinosiphilus TaxID=3053498 RepID=UPI002578FCF6|nr:MULTISPECIES: hypothetical protein [unclassified Variovorax]MDM0119725.1 hypothetical protein [Variovorax sp. J2L1-78]MDM0128363.1 hypothetical protein [Variovorax sp. J2L1-63]MDM0232063.1 hypothetical protein [Variovorax sp. J2R1-6]